MEERHAEYPRRKFDVYRRSIPELSGECGIFCLPVEYVPLLLNLLSHLETPWAWEDSQFADGYASAQTIRAELAMATCGEAIGKKLDIIIRLLGGVEDKNNAGEWLTHRGLAQIIGYRAKDANAGEPRHLREHIRELKEELEDIEKLLGD